MTTSSTAAERLPRVQPATGEDAEHIASLTHQRAPETIPVSADQVGESIDRYRVVREAGRVVAAAALHPVGANRLELRSVAVADGCGGRGLGTHVVGALQDEALRRRRRLVCVTMSPGFFARLGFERAPMSLVPPKPERRRWPVEAERVAMSWHPARDHERNDDARPLLRRSA